MIIFHFKQKEMSLSIKEKYIYISSDKARLAVPPVSHHQVGGEHDCTSSRVNLELFFQMWWRWSKRGLTVVRSPKT